MSKRWMAFVFLTVGMTVLACSDDDEGGDSDDKVRCQVEDDMGEVIGCNELAVSGAGADTARDACTSQGGTLVSRCPTADLIGTCSLANGGQVMHYYAAIGDAGDTEQVCVGIGGEWTPP